MCNVLKERQCVTIISMKIKNKIKKRYYIIGIGGVAMGNLAGLLKQKGHEVAGSDQAQMYEPMKSMLKKLGIKVFAPYKELHVKRWKPDVVVVGNAISRGNPELEYVMANGQIYRSVSDILREEFIEGKKAIVIAGTHGKTTTSALVSWILEYSGYNPTIFVGGAIRGFPPKADLPSADMRSFEAGFKLGSGEYIVLEGDEYNTSFFDKNPKFFGYRPYIGVINNIELDHIDVFGNLENLIKAFTVFSKLIPKNGLLVLNNENKYTSSLGLVKQPNSKITTFGIKRGDFIADKIEFVEGRMRFQVKRRGVKIANISTELIGVHNIYNILAAITVANFLKIPIKKVSQAISLFKGVKRRSEVIYHKNDITVIDDYAHHPTAVRETLSALRSMFPMKRLIALFEPGSASSKIRVFEDQYFDSFSVADEVYLYRPYRADTLKKDTIFRGKKLANKLNKAGVASSYFEDVDNLLFHVKSSVKAGDIVIVMSCRGFDGLRERLVKDLQ